MIATQWESDSMTDLIDSILEKLDPVEALSRCFSWVRP